MHLEILAQLKTLTIGKTLSPNRYIDLSKDVSKIGVYNDDLLIETSAKFSMTQVISGKRANESVTNQFEVEHNQAVRAMAQTIYGPVVEGLYPLLHQCYERGETETADNLSKLINDLRGYW